MMPVTGLPRFGGVYNVRNIVINSTIVNQHSGDSQQSLARQLLSRYAGAVANSQTPPGASGEDWFGSANHDLFSPRKSHGFGYIILNDDKGDHFTQWNEGVQNRSSRQAAQEGFMQDMARGAVPADLIARSTEQPNCYEFRVQPVGTQKKPAPRRTQNGKRTKTNVS